MSTMTHIRDVRKKAPMVTGLFGPLKDTVLLLKSRGIPMDLPPVNNQVHQIRCFHVVTALVVEEEIRVCGCMLKTFPAHERQGKKKVPSLCASGTFERVSVLPASAKRQACAGCDAPDKEEPSSAAGQSNTTHT